MSTDNSQATQDNDEDQDDAGSDLSAFYLAPYVDERGLLVFQAPPLPTVEQKALINDIVCLDHLSLRTLGKNSPERNEIMGLLLNAVVLGLTGNMQAQGRLLYQQAQNAYYAQLQAKHRIKYLLGALLGIACAGLIGTGLLFFIHMLDPLIDPAVMGLIFLFASMGSLASILTRLSSIDLKDQVSDVLLLVSGATRPIVALFFALVVYLILAAGIIDIRIGNASASNETTIYLIAAFLSGFSERFAQDLLSRVSFAGASATP